MPTQKGKLATVVALLTIATSIVGLLTWLGIKPEIENDSILDNLPISADEVEEILREKLPTSGISREQWQFAEAITKFGVAINQATIRVLEKGENFERYTFEDGVVSLTPKATFTDDIGRTCRKLSVNIDLPNGPDNYYTDTWCLEDGEWTRK